MAETTEERLPLPVDTTAAFAVPAVSSDPLVPGLEESVAEIVPLGAFKVTVPPGLSALSVVEVPSTVTTPSVPLAVVPAVRPRLAAASLVLRVRLAALPCSVVLSLSAPEEVSEAVTGAPAALAAALMALTSPDGEYEPEASVKV